MNVRSALCSRFFATIGALAGGVLLAAALALTLLGIDSSTAMAQEQPHQQDIPNSWRYIEGERIYEHSPLMLMSEEEGEEEPSFVPWSKTPEGFINPEGEIVVGALRKGVDVSKWNEDIDWAKVKAAGIEFAIIRCGYGSDYADQDDEFFLANVRGCIENGIDFGVYIYSYAYTEDMARSEAAHVLRLLNDAGLSPEDLKYSVYLDIEESGGKDEPCIRTLNPEYTGEPAEEGEEEIPQYIYHFLDEELLGKMTVAFAEIIEGAGYEVGCYANLNWWNNYMTNPVFEDYERWVAQWNYTCDYKGDYSMWQYTSNGNVDGIRGIVDCNFDYDPNRAKPEPPAPVETYTISASATPDDGGVVAGAGAYEKGATVALEAVAADGYKFVKWMANGVEVSTDASYSLVASENLDFVAVFEAVEPQDPSQPEGGESDEPHAPVQPDTDDDVEKPEKPESNESDKSDDKNAIAMTGDNTPIAVLVVAAAVSLVVAFSLRKRCV